MPISQLFRLALITFFLSFLLLPLSSSAADEPSKAQTKSLSIMEKHSIAIIDTLLAKDAKQSRFHYEKLREQISELQLAAALPPKNEKFSRELMMAYSLIRIINIEIKNEIWIEGAIAANQLSGLIIQNSHFATFLKRDLKWLDYQGREIKLLLLEDPVANADLLGLRKTIMENAWIRVRTELIQSFKNKPLVLQGNELINTINTSKDPNKAAEATTQWLIFVNALESKINMPRK